MASWLDRAKRLGSKRMDLPAGQAAIDKGALAKAVADSEKAIALKAEKQQSIREQIAVQISGILSELNKTLDGEVTPPAIERHHKRMLSVTAEVRSKLILVNVLSLSNGKTRITSYVGEEGDESELEFKENAVKEEISEWLGWEIVRAIERDDG